MILRRFAKVLYATGLVCVLWMGFIFYDGSRGQNVQIKLDCPPVKIRLSEQPLPLTGLLSLPGSGNTWLRHLIQQATGLGTGSIYRDRSLRRRGFRYEGFSGHRLLVIKSHETLNHKKLNFSRIVILLRNPYDAFRAEFSRYSTAGNHTGLPKRISIPKWHSFVMNNIISWRRKLANWMTFKGPTYLIKYEDLVTKMDMELKLLLEFLRVEVTNANISCTAINSEGNFHRRHAKSNSLLLPFNSALRDVVRNEFGPLYAKYKSIAYPLD